MVLVQVTIDIGKPPATVTSDCESCGRSFGLWLGLNGIRARVVDASLPLMLVATPEGIEYSLILIDAFHRWCEVAVSDDIPDHLQALGASAA